MPPVFSFSGNDYLRRMQLKSILSTIVLFSVITIGCTNTDEEADIIPEETVVIAAPDSLLVYDVDPEAKTIQRDTIIQDSFITLPRVVNGLMQKYPEVTIEAGNISNDTLRLIVTGSEYLSERMGSAGASAWFADAVINLTSVTGINFVKFDMKAGSHASPGVMGKQNYANYRKIQ